MISTTISFHKNLRQDKLLKRADFGNPRYPFLKKTGFPQRFPRYGKTSGKVLIRDLLLYKYGYLNLFFFSFFPFFFFDIVPVGKYLIIQFVSGTTFSPRNSKFSSFNRVHWSGWPSEIRIPISSFWILINYGWVNCHEERQNAQQICRDLVGEDAPKGKG